MRKFSLTMTLNFTIYFFSLLARMSFLEDFNKLWIMFKFPGKVQPWIIINCSERQALFILIRSITLNENVKYHFIKMWTELKWNLYFSQLSINDDRCLLESVKLSLRSPAVMREYVLCSYKLEILLHDVYL